MEQQTNFGNVTELGARSTYAYDKPSAAMLERFPNPAESVEYTIELEFPEFTSLCPKTGQPDFGTIRVSYIPRKWCVESKSLKLYYFAYRNEGAFMEAIVNRILVDFVDAIGPTWVQVEGEFNPRGATGITVTADHHFTRG